MFNFFTLLNSKIKKNGSRLKKPTKNLPTLKVYGPIKSIPISWATNAEPQRREVMIAQISENSFLFMACTILNMTKQQA